MRNKFRQCDIFCLSFYSGVFNRYLVPPLFVTVFDMTVDEDSFADTFLVLFCDVSYFTGALLRLS